MKLSRLLWPFPFLVRLGWLCGAANPDLDQARGRVFLLRGNAVVFSNGFGLLCRTLRQAGVWCEDLRCVGDLWACRRLRRWQEDGRLRGPIVFVGHSCGGRYSLYAAEALARWNISVDLVVCIDVALPPPVPANVVRAVNLYRSRHRLYPAAPLRPAAGSLAAIENHDLDAPTSPLDPHGLSHLTFTNSPALRDYVLERILAILHEEKPSAAQSPW